MCKAEPARLQRGINGVCTHPISKSFEYVKRLHHYNLQTLKGILHP